MSDNFFDKSILQTSAKQDEYESLKNYKELKYHLKKQASDYTFCIEIGDLRLNQGEIKAIIKRNEKDKYLTIDDVGLLTYISNKIGPIQTIYQATNDIDIILKHLSNSKFKTYLNEVEIKIVNEEKSLELEIYLDKNSNVTIDIQDTGGFFFGNQNVFYIDNHTIMPLSEELPNKFYKELTSGNNKFSIETFYEIKDTIMPKLKKLHKLNVSNDITELTNLNIEEKVAKTILEIGKSVHFITVQLKYKIGNELFNVENYKYYETQTWADKEDMIKIIREDDKLIKYIPDINISDEILDELFDGVRMKYSKNQKLPFQIMIPVASLDTFVKLILPRAEKSYDIVYKGGKKLTLSDTEVEFEIDTNLRRNLNLFEFKVRFKVADEYFDLDFLKDLMQKNRKHIQLKDGSTVNIENIREINKWIEFLDKFEFKRAESVYKSKTSAALELDEFLKAMKSKKINSNEDYKNIIKELKEKTPVEPIEIPKGVDHILRGYQKEGIYWMHFLKKYGFGGILADEMGLGKTIQTLAILAMNKDEGTHLVICPKSLIYNWENEIKKY